MITVMRRRTIMKTGIAGEEISKALYLIQAGKPIPKELTGSVARNVSTELVPTQESREKAIEFKVSFPVCDFHWEGPTIDDVRASGVFIAKPIAQALKLRWIPGTHDVADAHGRRATCNTAYGEGGRENGQQAFFVREDLLNNYLHRTKQVLIWVSWGERGIAHHLVDYVRENRKDFGQPFKVFHTVKVLRPTKGQL